MTKKLFISADIEGTTGICHWDETEIGHPGYAYFSDQMSREVAAACEGAYAAGVEEILVKDAHDSARNLNPRLLPENVKLFRGWSKDPLCMVSGLDATFDGIAFTGYHSAAGMDTNPLAHTMSTAYTYVKINDRLAPELLINGYAAAYYGVPIRLVTGDKGLCEYINAINPEIETAAVNEGVGAGVISLHPDKAVRVIREAAERAMSKPKEAGLLELPEQFNIEIAYKDHARARKAATSFPKVR